MNKKIPLITTVALMCLTAVTVFNITFVAIQNSFNSKIDDFFTMEEEYTRFAEIKAYVDKYFVMEYDDDAAMDAALQAYVTAMGDQYSFYFTAEQYEAYILENTGNIIGIGVTATYDYDNNSIYITDVYKDSPAGKAGIAVADYIVAVNGELVSEIGYSEAISQIRGEEGESVDITVLSGTEEYDVTIVRELFSTYTVQSEMLDDNVAYIKISEFSHDNTYSEFEKAVDSLIAEGATSLVFDLRFNPGGDLTDLVDCLDMLIGEGDVISLESKDGQRQTLTATAGELDMPMAVLVNAYSYSAAEFFAATLQEYGKATIVGDATTGKGRAQQMIPLTDGGALNLSTNTYYTSKGVSLADVGITPDVEVSLTDEKLSHYYMLSHDEDTQLQAAIAAVLN